MKNVALYLLVAANHRIQCVTVFYISLDIGQAQYHCSVNDSAARQVISHISLLSSQYLQFTQIIKISFW